MDKHMTELVDMFKDMVRCFDLLIEADDDGDLYSREITEDDIVNMLDWIINEGYTIQKESK